MTTSNYIELFKGLSGLELLTYADEDGVCIRKEKPLFLGVTMRSPGIMSTRLVYVEKDGRPLTDHCR